MELSSNHDSANEGLSGASPFQDNTDNIPTNPTIVTEGTGFLQPAPPPSPQPLHHQRSASNLSGISSLSVEHEGLVTEEIAYKLCDEETPTHSFYTTEFQRALRDGQEIAKGTATLVRSLVGIMDDESSVFLDRLREKAEGLSTFYGPEPRTIAVIGSSGEGKSSLINSLLHYPDIAKTGGMGSACTAVVTEYCQKRAEHGETPITIEAEFLTKAEIEDMIKELLWNYRQLFLPGVESDTTPEADYARYARESELAWSTLEVAFKHRPEFNRKILEDMSEGALARIEKMALGWASDIQWPRSPGTAETRPGLWQETAETVEECHSKTELFTQDQYWPFTKIIRQVSPPNNKKIGRLHTANNLVDRIYLSSPILKNGLVMADLPGLENTNLARVKNIQEYLMRCKNVFIVTAISRAVTNQSLNSSLYQVLSKHMPLEWADSGGKGFNLAVVCTRSEDIDLDRARSEFVGVDKRITRSIMDELDRDIAAAREAGDNTRRKALKMEQEWQLIKARNAHVTEGLQKEYASSVAGHRLNVFCVSNTAYRKYCRKGNATLVKNSGIPALRMFCHGISAEAQHQEARKFLGSRLANLIQSMILWASPRLVMREQEVSNDWLGQLDKSMLDHELDAALIKEITVLHTEFRKVFKEQILEMTDGRHEHWEEAAEKEGETWLKWHWTQYRAFCQNNGHHETTKHPREDWNAKIVWKMRTELEYQWDIVEDEVPVLFGELQQAVQRHLDSFQARTKASESEERTSALRDSLLEGLKATIRGTKYYLGTERDRFAREIRLIRRYASESNSNSYVLREMIPAYRSASSAATQGIFAHTKSIVQGRITNGTLFPNMSIALSGAVDQLLSQTDSRLSNIINEMISEIKEDLDLVFPAKGPRAKEAEDDMIATQLKSYALELVWGLQGRYKKVLDGMVLNEEVEVGEM
ncbi:hypothetical protein GQ53DRAFT_637825 [Thozetella sp. PMI_491]|nr:hypothetical protein GQ53DRAFT_637825 [Thozetella sp. PMI_491]